MAKRNPKPTDITVAAYPTAIRELASRRSWPTTRLGFLTIALLLVAGTQPTVAAEAAQPKAAQPDLVTMEAYYTRPLFDLDCVSSNPTHKVVKAKAAWVGPAVAKVGVKVGDLLVSIDGKPVTAMDLAELTALVDVQGDRDKNRRFVFSRRRGWMRKASTINVLLTPEAHLQTSPASSANGAHPGAVGD